MIMTFKYTIININKLVTITIFIATTNQAIKKLCTWI